jgi:entericidin B
MLRKAIALIGAIATVLLTACNTMEGAGRDIERGGEKIQGAADKNKR